MIKVYGVRPEKQAELPAVTHVDGTGRLQTVDKQTAPLYWKLIHAFGQQTGTPVVLNTSFNLKGEPIVCTPQDALRTFFTSGLDFLVIEDFIVPKYDVREILDRALEATTVDAGETA